MRKSPIASALFSRTQQRLLSALLLNSREPVYSAELARRFAVRPSTLQRLANSAE
jgi:chromosome segregation and condensation protein ScpB